MFEPVRQQWAGRALAAAAVPGLFQSAYRPPQELDEAKERADSYARGHADGLAAAADALLAQRRAIEDLAAAIADSLHLPPGSIEALLGEAAGRIADALGADTETVGAAPAIAAIAQAIVGECEAVAVHVHPAQAAQLSEIDCGVPVIADAGVAAGAVRVRTRGGWIEDGVPVRLARFRAALERGDGA